MNKKQTAVFIALANKEGYTVNAQTLETVTTGYAVAVADTQKRFLPHGMFGQPKKIG